MATLDKTPSRPALDAAVRALDRAVFAAIEGKPRHASGTTFVPSDIRPRHSGRVVLVHPDGREERVRDPRLEVIGVLVIAGLIGWALARRPLQL